MTYQVNVETAGCSNGEERVKDVWIVENRDDYRPYRQYHTVNGGEYDGYTDWQYFVGTKEECEEIAKKVWETPVYAL